MRSTVAEFMPRMMSRLSPVQMVWSAQLGSGAVVMLAILL